VPDPEGVNVAQRDDWINERMKKLTAQPFCPQCYLFLEEHDDSSCDLRWVEEEQEEINKLEQRMCMECAEAGIAAVTILASWRLWLHRIVGVTLNFLSLSLSTPIRRNSTIVHEQTRVNTVDS
jgi:hypothetical protein